MRFLCSSKLSEHRYKTPEGYLVCVDSVLSRTGTQTYTRDELFHDSDMSEISVNRTPEEVFSDAALASFENKPLTIEHPDEDVNPNNHNKLSVGFVRDIKRGKDNGTDVMLGTLVITDSDAIELVESGRLTDLSCGYDCDISDEEMPQQKNIRGNHVALCEKGRAGNARIVDSADVEDEVKPTAKSIYKGYDIIATSVNFHNAPTQVDIYEEGTKKKFKSYFTAEKDLDKAINEAKTRYMAEVPLTKKNKDYVSNYLNMISGFVRRKDTDIQDILRPLYGKGYKCVVDKVQGWDWKQNQYATKNYYISFDGYTDHFIVTLYADPEQDWDTKEVNAYFLDSVNDSLFSVSYKDGNAEEKTVQVVASSMKDAIDKVDRATSMKKLISVEKIEDEDPYKESTENLEKELEHTEDACAEDDYRYSPADIKVGKTFIHRRKGKFTIIEKAPGSNKVLIRYENEPNKKYLSSTIDLAEDLNGGIILMRDSIEDSADDVEIEWYAFRGAHRTGRDKVTGDRLKEQLLNLKSLLENKGIDVNDIIISFITREGTTFRYGKKFSSLINDSIEDSVKDMILTTSQKEQIKRFLQRQGDPDSFDDFCRDIDMLHRKYPNKSIDEIIRALMKNFGSFDGTLDSMKDAKHTYEIRWINRHDYIKGTNNISADSPLEALEIFKKQVSPGWGLVTIVNMKSESTTYQYSGSIDKMQAWFKMHNIVDAVKRVKQFK